MTRPASTGYNVPVVWSEQVRGMVTLAVVAGLAVTVTWLGTARTQPHSSSADTGCAVVEPRTDESAADPEPTGMRAELVVDGLDSPVDVTQLPGWDMLVVVEKPGRVVGVRDGQVLEPPLLDISDLILDNFNERGLLTIAASPRFAEDCEVYLFYTDLKGDSNLVAARVAGTDHPVIDRASMRAILVVPQKQQYHQSGSIAFGADEVMWLSVGDGGLRQEHNSQNPRTLEGSIIRLDPTIGPYSHGEAQAFGALLPQPEVWAHGLRNPWRISIDVETGTIFIPDTGSETTEELNVVHLNDSGHNFGWPITEGDRCAGDTPCSTVGITMPDLAYGRSGGNCAIVGGRVYRGSAVPELAGQYLFSDFCSGRVKSLTFEDGEIIEITDWSSHLEVGSTVTSFGADLEGELYLTTLSGKLWKMVPAG